MDLPPYQLFDLDADPGETTNRAADHPDVVQQLGRLLRSIIERGRSTPGPAQSNASDVSWPQVEWMKDFA